MSFTVGLFNHLVVDPHPDLMSAVDFSVLYQPFELEVLEPLEKTRTFNHLLGTFKIQFPVDPCLKERALLHHVNRAMIVRTVPDLTLPFKLPMHYLKFQAAQLEEIRILEETAFSQRSRSSLNQHQRQQQMKHVVSKDDDSTFGSDQEE